MYCGTRTTWKGNMIVPSMRANRTGLSRNCSRAKAYAASEHENRFPTTDRTAITAELKKKRVNGIPSASHPCMKLSSVISRGHKPGSEKISWLGLNALDSIHRGG